MNILIDDILYKKVTNYAVRGVFIPVEEGSPTLELIEISFNQCSIMVRDINKVQFYFLAESTDEPELRMSDTLERLLNDLTQTEGGVITEIHYKNYLIR
jgi:hypothetical protein